MYRAALRSGIAAGLLVGAVSTLGGQTTDERARLERLERRYETLSARWAGAGADGTLQVDSVAVGPVWILSDSVRAAGLRQAADGLARLIRDHLGPVSLDGPLAARIIVPLGARSRAWGSLVVGDAQFIDDFGGKTPPDRLLRQLAHAVQVLVGLRAGASFASWGADVRLFDDQGPLFEATNIELQTSNAPGAERCVEGHVDGCARALSLPVAASGPGTVDDELRRFVEARLDAASAAPPLQAAYTACVESADADACHSALEQAGMPAPLLSPRARGTLLATVGAVGGPVGMARFLADTGMAIVPRLEAGAGVSLDSLLRVWRTTILDQRPPEPAVASGAQWITLLWVTVLAALATRSTRWR